jgi:hypothetical protein
LIFGFPSGRRRYLFVQFVEAFVDTQGSVYHRLDARWIYDFLKPKTIADSTDEVLCPIASADEELNYSPYQRAKCDP